ncbi:chitosanase, partial [Streptomyces sp. ZG43]
MARREAGVALLERDTPRKEETARRLVSSAANSSLDWRAQYRHVEDTGDGRGYTAGIIGTGTGTGTGTGDMLALVERYTRERPDAELPCFHPALREVRGRDSHQGLGSRFTRAWPRAAGGDRAFRGARDGERDR